jgi:hypothetical protein
MPRLFALLLLLLVIPGASGQGFSLYNLRNHPELRWREAETPHFLIRYPDRIAGIEVEAAVIAESTYAVLSHNLGVTFEKKIPIYLSDEDEIVNGFATPLNGGYTMIWVHQNAVAGTWTGRDKWLRRVIPHEIAHLFHYRAVRSRVGVIGLGLGDALPRFWTEGLAQYETETWDAERGERYLRVAALEGTLNYDDGRSAWNGRLLYAVGNSQVRFFAQQYGDSALAQLLKHRSPALLGLVRVHDFYRAFAATTGEPYPAFARRWRRHISAQYGARAVAAEPPESLGTARPSSLGQYVYDVRPSPADTATWAVVRLVSLGRPVRQLVLADSTGGRLVAEGAIETPVAWSPDGRRLAFAQTGRARYGSLLADLYLYSLDTRRTQRLTRNRRASSPVFSPDGRRLAYVATNVGTANVFLLDLDTGDERALTAFTGDEQIERLAWRPRTDEITLAHFTATGERALYSLHVGTGALRRLTDGLHDDRAPVWRPDGTVLAFTSLRDNVPNAFVLDPETGAVQRVTAVVQGAEATAWLPPDSTHAAGRLILLVRPSKTQDEVYVVGADRRAEAPPVNVPPHYTAWETHRPPRTVPEVLAPDTAFVLRRGRYRALSNLKPVVTVPYPFTNGRAWGLGAFTLWLEPLGKHALTGYGGVLPTAPEESFGVVTYRNGTLGPTIDATLYYFPESARIYGPDVLVERVGGGEVLVRQPLNLGRLAYAYADGVAGLTVDRAVPLNAEELTDLGGLAPPEASTLARLKFGAGIRRQRPWRDALIHPLDGYGARALFTVGTDLAGADRYVRTDVAAYRLLPGPGLHRVFVYGRHRMLIGQSPPQDYIGLSQFDGLQLALPAFLPVILDRNERVRGYRQAVAGRAVAFGSVEYRAPLMDLNTVLFGSVRLGASTLALFADGAIVGRTLDFRDPVKRLGAGAEVKNVLQIGPLALGHALGVAQPAARLFGKEYEVYYRIRLGVPF